MASKLCFFINQKNEWEEKLVDYVYVKGITFQQKQKNVRSFHSYIQERLQVDKSSILEVSTKSDHKLGITLSAFNLKLNGISLESIYQSSKVFNEDIQFLEAIKMRPLEAKQYVREHSKGKFLTGFKYKNISFSLFPPSMFYDYVYIQAVLNSNINLDKLSSFNVFTDIEFNEKKQINSQARAVSILCSLYKRNLLFEVINDLESFKKNAYHKVLVEDQTQLTLF